MKSFGILFRFRTQLCPFLLQMGSRNYRLEDYSSYIEDILCSPGSLLKLIFVKSRNLASLLKKIKFIYLFILLNIVTFYAI